MKYLFLFYTVACFGAGCINQANRHQWGLALICLILAIVLWNEQQDGNDPTREAGA